MHNGSSIKLLTGNSHPELAQQVADRLGIPLTKCTVKKFSDNETSVSIGESVREEDVYILQTGFNPSPYRFGSKNRTFNHTTGEDMSRPGTPVRSSSIPPTPTFEVSRPGTPFGLGSGFLPPKELERQPEPFNDPNDLLMELLILVSACKTASAKRITCVIPCFPYARMDRKDKARSPITAKLVANMLEIAGCDHVITMDLHASQIQGFFEVPVDNLWTEPSMVRWIKENVPGWQTNSIIVSPDANGAKRATTLADRLDVDFALINRNRTKGDAPGVEGAMEILVGDVKGKVAILIDDMCDTGYTIKHAMQALIAGGAKSVYAIVSHGLLSGETMGMLAKLPLEKVVVTNTICQTEHLKQSGGRNGKLEIMDISPVLAESIRRAHNGESLSLMFSEGGASIYG